MTTIFLGTFPYKLWDLINSPKNNGIQWCRNGKMISIEKKLFQKKCLNKRNFTTSRFISITKQLNVYGFVQQAHMDTDRFLIYKHENFVKGHPELLRNMGRRIQYKKSYKPKEPSEPNVKVDPVLQARLHFKFVLNNNVDKVLKLPTGDSDDECSSNSSSSGVEVTFSNIKSPQFPAPARHDPTTLMWNGSTIHANHQLYPNLYYVAPSSPSCCKTDKQNPENPCFPINPIPACSRKKDSEHQCKLFEDKEDLDFGLNCDELQNIFLDSEFQAIYKEIIESCPEI